MTGWILGALTLDPQYNLQSLAFLIILEFYNRIMIAYSYLADSFDFGSNDKCLGQRPSENPIWMNRLRGKCFENWRHGLSTYFSKFHEWRPNTRYVFLQIAKVKLKCWSWLEKEVRRRIIDVLMLVAPPGPCPLSTFEAAEISVQKFQLSSLP